jgi:hypothetical protein
MKKHEIYVEITNEKERLRALEILEKAGEIIFTNCSLKAKNGLGKLTMYHDGEWIYNRNIYTKRTKITLEQLEEMLMPKSENPLFIAQRYIIDNFPPGTVVTITNGLIEVK